MFGIKYLERKMKNKEKPKKEKIKMTKKEAVEAFGIDYLVRVPLDFEEEKTETFI